MRTPGLLRSGLIAAMLCGAALLPCQAPSGLAPATLAAQGSGGVTGTVTNEAGQPVSGALVEVVGTGRSAVTGPDGRYTITGVAPGSHQVRVSAMGLATMSRSVAVAAGQTASASFQGTAQAVALEGLVVVGYTTQQQRQVSGAVASVSPAQLEQRKVVTVEQALKGQVPGVNIVASGEPGRPASVIIRGQNFTTDPSPLYVVDGMYMRQNPGLNPDDVESVQVLKDASAASQYGAQSANGVIVITTKRGREGVTRISGRSYYGFHETPRTLDLASANEWADLTRAIYAGAGENPPPGALQLNGVNTDWQDAVLGRGAIQNHNLQISGATPTASYLLSGGYANEDGTVRMTDFERFSFRINSEFRRGILTLGENLSLSRAVRNNLRGNPLLEAVRMPPVIPVYDTGNASGFGFGSGAVPTFGTNPVGQLELETSTDNLNQVIGTLYGQLDLTDQVSFRVNLGTNYQDLNWRNFRRMGSLRLNNPVEPNRLTDRRDNSGTLLLENLLSFNDAFGPHEVNAVAGYTEQRDRFNRLEAFRRNFPDETLTQINAGTSEFNNAGFETDSRLRSFLGRVNYALHDRYLLTGTFRRDGSSRFGPRNRWGNFGALSAGWVVSEEGFFSDRTALANFMPYLKLRASYGVLGNQDIGNYQYAAQIFLNRSYIYGNQVGTGAIQVGLANPDIKWQEDHQTNFGADIGLFGDALTVTLDYFTRETEDILVPASLPLSVVGYLNAPYEPRIDLAPTVNAGSIRSRGFEMGARHRLAAGDFQLNTNLNLTSLRSEVTSLGNGLQALCEHTECLARTEVGAPISSYYVLKTAGIFQSQAEVQEHRAQPNARPGDVRYVDLSGPNGTPDGVINEFDRYMAGSAVPDFEGGLFFDGSFRALDFALGLRGVYGNEVFNMMKFWTERMNDLSNYRRGLEPWTPQNQSTTTPRAVFGPQGRENARLTSDRWIEDGSFLRVQSLELGYALGNLTQPLGLQLRNSRVYVNLQNVHTFTGYSGWDPEVRAGDSPLVRGIDDARIYPNPRTIIVGIDLGL